MQGSGFRVQGSGCRILSTGSRDPEPRRIRGCQLKKSRQPLNCPGTGASVSGVDQAPVGGAILGSVHHIQPRRLRPAMFHCKSTQHPQRFTESQLSTMFHRKSSQHNVTSKVNSTRRRTLTRLPYSPDVSAPQHFNVSRLRTSYRKSTQNISP